MDPKDLRTEPALSDRSRDVNTNYATSGPSFQCANKNKSYHDIGSNSLPKVDGQTTRPCAVIGPDRIVPPPQPAADPYLKHGLLEPWQFTRPPEHLKLPDYQHQLARNISPRQTFQENMPRIMVPPVRHNPAKVVEDVTFTTDKSSSLSKNTTKLNMPSETKYCDVPYTVTPLTNEHKSVRNTELPVSNVDPVLARNATHAWSHGGVNVRPPQGYGLSELYHCPDYSSCAAPRTTPMNRMHRPGQEEALPIYPDVYYRGGNIRFEPYPTAKDRYQPSRYDYITNYPNPPTYSTPHYPSQKYDVQKLPTSALPSNPYPGYSHVPLKYLEKMREPIRDGYQRSPTQTNYGVPFHNPGMHPNYGPVAGNCFQNKLYTYPTDTNTHADPHPKQTYETNKAYMQSKHYPTPNNYFLNELPGSHHMKPQMVMPNYPAMNMHPVPPYPYYKKEGMVPYKNYDFPMQYKNADPIYNTQLQRISSQFSPNIISPVESNTSNDHSFSVSPEDCGYVSQSSTTSIRSTDSAMNRYRVFDPRYGHMIRGSPLASRLDPESKTISSKDKKNIDLRQFLQSWNEGDDEHGEGNANKEAVHPNNSDPKRHEVVNNQEQLYVLGLVNVPSEELDKYEHIQKVSKLPDNIKGYTSIDLLNQFEVAIGSTKQNNPNYSSQTPEKTKPKINAHLSLSSNRPPSPLDVEAKISQSVIHKEVGCNFELRLCSPKMMNVEVASAAQNVLGERVIEKVANPLIVKSPSMIPNIEENCSIVKRQNRRRSLTREEAPNIPSCKMVKTQYSVETSTENKKSGYSIQDLESNSGVCLASLPRLDNDIELSFPEVNQQFINANKVDPTAFTTPRENVRSVDTDETVSLSSKQTIENKDNDGYPFSPSEEFSKLSKYRKLKTNKESIDPPVQKTAQPVRTDSVIIKNPEKSENITMAGEKIDKFDQCNEGLAPTQRPMNLALHSSVSSNSTYLGDACEVKSSAVDTLTSIQNFNNELSLDNINTETHIAEDSRSTEDIATDLTSSKNAPTKNDHINNLSQTHVSLESSLQHSTNDSGCNEFTINEFRLDDDDEVLSVEQERRRQSLSLKAQLTPMSEDNFSDSSETESDGETGEYIKGSESNTAPPDEIKKTEKTLYFVETKYQTKDNAKIEKSTTKDNLPNAWDLKCNTEKAELKKADDLNNLSESISKDIPNNYNEIGNQSELPFNVSTSKQVECKNAIESFSKNLSETKVKVTSETFDENCQKSSELIKSEPKYNVSSLKKGDESTSDNIPETSKEICQISSAFMKSEPTSNVPTVSSSLFKNTVSHNQQSDDSDSDSLSDSETSSSESSSEAEQFSNTDNDTRDLASSTSKYSNNSKTVPASNDLESTSLIADQLLSPAYRSEEKQFVFSIRNERMENVASIEPDRCSSQEKRQEIEQITNLDSEYNIESPKVGEDDSSSLSSNEKSCVVSAKSFPSVDVLVPIEIMEDKFQDGTDQLLDSSALEKSLKIQTNEDNCKNAKENYEMDISTNSLSENVVYTCTKRSRRKSVFFCKELFSAVFQHLILEEGLHANISGYESVRNYSASKCDTDKAEHAFKPEAPDQKSPTDLVEENLERIHASDTSVQDSSDETEEHMDSRESDSMNETHCDKSRDAVFFCNEDKQVIEASKTEDLLSSLGEETPHGNDKLKHFENESVLESGLSELANINTHLNPPNVLVKQVIDDELSKSETHDIANIITSSKDDDFESSSSCSPENITIQTNNNSQENSKSCHSESELSNNNKIVTQFKDKDIFQKSYKSEDITIPQSLPKNTREDLKQSSSSYPPENITVQTDNISQESHSESGKLRNNNIKVTQCKDKDILENSKSYKSEDITVPQSLPKNFQEDPYDISQPVVDCPTRDKDNDGDNATQCDVPVVYESSGFHQTEEIHISPTHTEIVEEDVSKPYEICQSEPEPLYDIDSVAHFQDEDVFEKPIAYEPSNSPAPRHPTNNSLEESCVSCQSEPETSDLNCKEFRLQDQSDKISNFDLNNSQNYRRTSKRSLSESAIYSISHTSDKDNENLEQWCWSKRKKIAEPNEDLNSPFLTPENLSRLMQSRRNSISSFYNDENVSFCILIDNDCIISQEEFDQEAICFADIPEENFSTVVDNHILASNEESTSTTPLNQSMMIDRVLFPLSPETVEEKTVEASWVEDVACMETVISEDVVEDGNAIYEGMAVTSPNYDDTTSDSDKSDPDMFTTNDHADKIKHIYGNEICSSQSINFIKTLYTTPQMDVNKTLHYTESLGLENINKTDPSYGVNKTFLKYGKLRCDHKVNSEQPLNLVQEVEDNSCVDDVSISENDTDSLTQEEGRLYETNEFAISAALKSPEILCEIQDEIAQQSEESNDEVFYPEETADRPANLGSSSSLSTDDVFYPKETEDRTTSSSPEVSSTTEEKKSGILLKITNYNGSRISHINNVDGDSNRRIRCKFTEENDYRSNLTPSRPLITKAAQKYIPPLKETTINDLKVKLVLPEDSLLKLKQIKLSKEQPKIDVQKQSNAKTNFKIKKTETIKKTKPKFEDVLKSIDEIQIKMHKEKSKKIEKAVPKVIIKKNGNGSHYASSSAKKAFNPDMTGRKWQPWVFLEKYEFIDKMALSGKTRAVYCHRKKTFILAERFKKYKSIGTTNFFISQPKSHGNTAGPLKYTIKLQQVYKV